MPLFDRYDNGITRLCREVGRIGLIRRTFEAAREANPGTVLLLNDFDVSTAYDVLIEGCREAGIPIDVIGIQSHMHQGYWGTERTLAVMERFSRFNLPIHFTENDLNDYQPGEWPTTPEGEERQAHGLLRHDHSPKPSYEALLKLVKGEWWLAPAEMRTDASGRFSLCGFLGEYAFLHKDRKVTFTLTKPGNISFTLRL
jgi:endo-1,4-beta-xylanase